ncbi:MerR family transcriptional regulator [Actinomadura barringtoniae]|uniref:MerR family transcriptional regulator n=1 Tax=Actinomadura barringtoniae TaxID=1427535 RepID=A0A939PKL4_9ACTN|nr:MerR family transcriptional regulator [Actinomadura barringtoniae]MBO2454365.1 MerR family transcriptional regulator [Actinomadura barringtoniae]
MDGGTLCTIGELARRTGLTVKTIRFYSERGIVVPAERTAGGYRLYGADAVARLALVRTLRELGVGLDAIRQVVERELTLSEVAAQHAAALEVQIGVLRLRRTVLAAAARRRPTPEEMERMHRLARLTETERERLIEEFLEAVFGGLEGGAPRCSMKPELPGDPTEEQVEAWVELAELALDPGFRASVRRGAEEHAADGVSCPPRPGVVAIARDYAEQALASGIAPESSEADEIVAALTADCARSLRRPDDRELHRLVLRRWSAANDVRRDRYLYLLSLINGWSAPERLAPALDWSVAALRSRVAA